MNLLVHREILPRSLESVRVPMPRTKVAGPETIAPLQPEPTIVTHGSVLEYIVAIDDLATCLDGDAREHLIYQNPGKLTVEAVDLQSKATAIDGCVETSVSRCPGPDESPAPTSPIERAKRFEANALRVRARGNMLSAQAMYDRATARGLGTDPTSSAQVSSELSLYDDLSKLRSEIAAERTTISGSTVASTGDWKAVQALDVRYQALRARYVALGFTPSCAVPTFPKDTILPTWTPWAIGGTAIVVVGGLAAYVILRGK